jgi:ORF6N domain
VANPIDLLPAERIQSRILVLRGQRVLLDADLAAIYEVPTKQPNQAVKRNLTRFPDDFMFQLAPEEAEQVLRSRSQSVTLKAVKSNRSQIMTGSQKHRDPKNLPYAFTEHGAVQLSNVLRSERAVEMGIAVVRAFVQLRALMVNHKTLRTKLAELDARVGAHDEQLAALIEAIRALAVPVEPTPKRKIGYHPGNR